MKKYLLITVFVCLVVSCTTTGNHSLEKETEESISEKFKEGKTTKQELIDALGIPNETSFTGNGLEIVRYKYARFTPKARNFIPYNFFSVGENGHQKELTVLFDENNIVKKLAMNESNVETFSGLAE